MPTVKELREQAKSYGLRGYTPLRKFDLIKRISEVRVPVFRERFQRALQTGRYPALRGGTSDPTKKAQRMREWRQLQDEVTAALRAKKYEQDAKRDPWQRIQTIKKVTKRVLRHGFRERTIAASLIEKGPKLLEELIPQDSEENGRRVVVWKLFRDLDGSVVDRVYRKVETLKTAFYLRFSFTYQLRNIENGKVMLFHKNLGGSPALFTTHSAAKAWVEEKDASRMDIDKIERPNTKWAFVRWAQVEVKAILTKQTLLGNGQLPDWLRNKKGLYALDTFADNLCLFRCLAVHQGLRPDRCTEQAKMLAGLFYFNDPAARPQVYQKMSLVAMKKFEEKFKVGVRVYEPSENEPWRLVRQPAAYEAVGNKPMTIGFYSEHAFLITDIQKVTNQYACGHCNQQFTNASNLQRHAERCTKGATEICCPGEVVERPQSAYERAFYPKSNASKSSIQWLEYESKQRGLHIHHAYCGHGGERWIAGAPVDGYEPTTKTVFQYHGCQFHGCSAHCKRNNARELRKKTRQQEQKIKDAGYQLVVVWECHNPKRENIAIPEPQTVIYPHAIVYDFEAYLDKTKSVNPTNDLTYDNTHVPISVSVGDTLLHEPVHLCDADPKALVKAFASVLERRAGY
jgi:hypothetical protein